MEVAFEVADVCRLCIEDLSSMAEYYSIDEELGSLLIELTGIEVDYADSLMPGNICPDCFYALTQFNDLRYSWHENQAKLLKNLENQSTTQEATEDNIDGVKKENEIDEELFEMDDVGGEFDYPVEYVEELDFNEASLTAEESTDQKDEDVKPEPQKAKKLKEKSKRSRNDTKDKGKDIYQKLLQTCSICSKKIEKNRMEGHLNKHYDIRPYACDVNGCEKTFYCKLLMRLHRTSIHTGRRICCEVCNKVFPSERSLYSHTLRHKNENRYNCTYCDRKFNNSNTLKRHLAIHSGIREFSCEFCTSSFYRKFNLDVHIKTVHNSDKSFSCKLCPKKYGYARLLRDHMQKNHSMERVVIEEC